VKGNNIRLIFAFLFLSLIGWIAWDWNECSFSEEYAISFLSEKLIGWNLKPEYLSTPHFVKEQCTYYFMYEGEGRKIDYIFTSWGKIHLWDYANGDGP
jgi:hypothetical protein